LLTAEHAEERRESFGYVRQLPNDDLAAKAREDLKNAKRCHAHMPVTMNTMIVARLERWSGLLAPRYAR